MKTISILLLALSLSACAPIFVNDNKSLGDDVFSAPVDITYAQQQTPDSFHQLPNNVIEVK